LLLKDSNSISRQNHLDPVQRQFSGKMAGYSDNGILVYTNS